MNDLLKRRGKFIISHDMIRRADTYGSSLFQLFSKMIVVRAESDFLSREIEYTAISPMFRPISESDATPEYDIVFDAIYYEEKISRYEIYAVERK